MAKHKVYCHGYIIVDADDAPHARFRAMGAACAVPDFILQVDDAKALHATVLPMADYKQRAANDLPMFFAED